MILPGRKIDVVSDYKRILVTAALPYANGPLHLGHLAGAYLPADIFVRYNRLKGRDVVFICGTDEHGVPIALKAVNEGKTPQELVDYYYIHIKENFENFGIGFDNFSRTSLPLHHETASDFFLKLKDKGYLVEKETEQFYDEEWKMFLPDRFVSGICPHCSHDGAKGDQCENCGKWYNASDLINPMSQLSGNPPVRRKTSHWYMKIGDFQSQLEEFIGSKSHWKQNVVNYCRGWLDEGLGDRAVTRDLKWGVPVPLEEAEGKIIYVWFEAVLGYISSTKEWAANKGEPDLWEKYWKSDDSRLIHFIGKDNIVFHALMFPAMLMGYGGYVLQDNVPANEFLNIEGGKLSTSRNYAVWLHEYLEIFEPDPLRYTLAVNLPETKDSDFSWRDFQSRNNNELADILGNFVHRTMTFAHRYFGGEVPEPSDYNAVDERILSLIESAPGRVGEFYENFRVRDGVRATMDLARAGNKYFNENKPWETRKSDTARCATAINICLQLINSIGILMDPVIPFTAGKIKGMLFPEADIDDFSWDDASKHDLEPHRKLGQPEVLFPKIEDDLIAKEAEKLNMARETGVPDGDAVEKENNHIEIEAFDAVDLRVARVLTAEKVPDTDKLLKLRISLGSEERQIVAGIATDYSPDELIGKKIIVVANLEPAVIRGVESNGMLLAAGDGDNFTVLTVDRDIAEGSKIT